MPQAIPILVSSWASAAVAAETIGAFTAFALTVGSSLVVNAYQQDRAESKAKRAARDADEAARNAYNESVQDRLITVRSGVSTRKYILGTVRAGGTLMYADTIGPNQTAFDSVIAFSGNRTQIVGYYLDDEYISAANFPGPKYGYTGGVATSQDFMWAPQPGQAGGQEFILDFDPIGQVNIGAYGGEHGYVIDRSAYTWLGRKILMSYSPLFMTKIQVSYNRAEQPKMYAVFMNGGKDQGPVDWGSLYPSPLWGPEHRLRGVSYLRTLMLWDENVYAQGAPAVGGVFAGSGIDDYPFYDPRNASYPTYTANPAILAYWWMRLPRALGGMGIPDSWIDVQTIINSANVCDEQMQVRSLDGQSYEWVARYECMTVLDTANSPESNLQVILDSMAGRKVFTSGKYRIVAGAYRPAVYVITDDDVIGDKPLGVVTAASTGAPPNIATARFADKTKNWIESSPAPVRNQTYVDRDGFESPIDLNLVATTDSRRARYLMGVALETGRPAFTCTVSVGGIGEDLALLDTVQLSISNRDEYRGRTFEVLGRTDNWDGTFQLTLSEIRPQTWELDPDTLTPVHPVVLPDLSYLWNVAPLDGFEVAFSPAQLMPDGTGVSHITLSWFTHSQPYVLQGGWVELRYRQVGTGVWAGIPEVEAASNGTQFTASLINTAAYEFQGRVRNSLGAYSNWVSAYEVVDGVAVVTPSMRIKASSLQFKVAADGSFAPPVITLEPVFGGALTGPVTWNVVSGTVTALGASGDSRTLAYSDMKTDVVTIEARAEYGSGTVTVFTDLVTIIKVYDGYPGDPGAPGAPGDAGAPGADAVTGFLTTDTIVLPADSTGAVTSYAGATTTMVVYKGTENDSSHWTYTRILGPGVTTATISGNVLTVASVATAMVNGYVDIVASHPTLPAITKRVNVGKLRQGAVGPAGNPGAAGQRGSIQLATPRTGTGWSDAIASGAIVNAGYGQPQHLDMVTIYSTTDKWSEARAFMVGSWQPIAAYINGNMVVNGTLGAEAFAAKSITTDKLAVQAAYGTILNPDPGIEDKSVWSYNPVLAERVSLGQQGYFGRWCWRAYSFATVIGPPTPVQRNKVYRVSARALRESGSSATVYLFVYFLDANSVVIPGSYAPWPSSSAGDSYHYYGLIGAAPPVGSWDQEFYRVFGAGQSYGIPVGATQMGVGALLSYNNGGHSAVHGMRITEMVEGELVVDGSILARNVNLDDGHIKSSNRSGYAWPNNNSAGFYVGPEGILLGDGGPNATIGYVEMQSAGNLFMPGLRFVGRQMYLDALNVVGTLNVAGRSITAPTFSRHPWNVNELPADVPPIPGAGDSGP